MGKLWIFGAAIEAGYVWLAVIGVVNSALSLYYYVRVVVFMWSWRIRRVGAGARRLAAERQRLAGRRCADLPRVSA
jgi:NADH:ubiquinone oxidoreductase subunit 2 (subunit N)